MLSSVYRAGWLPTKTYGNLHMQTAGSCFAASGVAISSKHTCSLRQQLCDQELVGAKEIVWSSEKRQQSMTRQIMEISRWCMVGYDHSKTLIVAEGSLLEVQKGKIRKVRRRHSKQKGNFESQL